jgi:hypothetical protein
LGGADVITSVLEAFDYVNKVCHNKKSLLWK